MRYTNISSCYNGTFKKIKDVFFMIGFPGGTSSKESTCQCRRHKRCRFDPWVGKIPWSRKWQPALVSLPGKFHGQAVVHGVAKNWTWLSVCARVHTHTHTHTHILYDTKWLSPVLGMALCISHEGIVSGLQPLIPLPTLEFSVLRHWIGTLQTRCLLCQQLCR